MGSHRIPWNQDSKRNLLLVGALMCQRYLIGNWGPARYRCVSFENGGPIEYPAVLFFCLGDEATADYSSIQDVPYMFVGMNCFYQ